MCLEMWFNACEKHFETVRSAEWEKADAFGTAGLAMLGRLPQTLQLRIKVDYHVGTSIGDYPTSLSFEGLRGAAVRLTETQFGEAQDDCLRMGKLALAFAPVKAQTAFAALGFRPSAGTVAPFVPPPGAPRGGRSYVGTPRGPPRPAAAPVGAPRGPPAAPLAKVTVSCTKCGGDKHTATSCNISAAALAARIAARPAAPPAAPRPRP
jgi:hypothetical protein